MNRKGSSGTTYAILFAMGLVVVVAGAAYFGALPGQATAEPTVFEGEFDAIQDLQEVSGTDLTITDQDLPDNGTVYDSNIVFSFDVNETDGQTHYAAFGFSVDDGLNDVEVDAAVQNTTAFDLRRAYIIDDAEGATLSHDDSTARTLTIDNDDEDIDSHEIGDLADGEYVFVAELKAINTAGVASDADILSVKMEGDGDSDETETLDLEASPIDNE